MTNLISSDLYRIRHGAAMRNTVLGLLGAILFLGITFTLLTSDGITIMLDEAQEYMSEQEKDALAQMDEVIPVNAAEFASEIVQTNMIPLFALAIVIVVFCADFSSGAFRNTLSYETNRTRVYLSKLLLGVLLLVGLNIACLLLSWLVGGLLMGFGGFSAPYLQQLLVGMLLLLISQISILCFGFCIVALTRKTSTTSTTYILVLLLSSVVFQLVSLLPRMSWVSLFDWNSVGTVLLNYRTATPAQLGLSVGASLVGIAATTIIGLNRFKAADLV